MSLPSPWAHWLDHKITGVVAGCLLILLIGFEVHQKLRPEPKESIPSIDTLIPRGMRLYPIQLKNQESLQSFVGDFAMVDLYQVTPAGRRGKLVGKKLKLLRAPLNPQEFALLLREQDVPLVSGENLSFFAVIENPDKTSSGEILSPSQASRVEYQHE